MTEKLTRPEKPKLERPGAALGRSQAVFPKPTDPDFESMFEEPDENPMQDIALTGDLQADADAGMSEALREIIERKRHTQERFRVAVDPEYFFCVCFQSREQKDEFLQKAGWEDMGDKYLNGIEVARRLNIPVAIIPLEPLKIRGRVNRYKKDDIIP